MKSLLHILPLFPLTLALNSDFKPSHSPLHLPTLKRQYETCEATYGGGSITCGDPSQSHYCYDPTKGQTCCPLDFGYCNAGDYCAPVEGYCCHNDEDLGICASRLKFPVPASLATASSTSTTSLVSTATANSVIATISIMAATSAAPAPPQVSVSEVGGVIVSASGQSVELLSTTVSANSVGVPSTTISGGIPESTAAVGNGTGVRVANVTTMGSGGVDGVYKGAAGRLEVVMLGLGGVMVVALWL